MSLKHIDLDNYEEEVENSEIPVVIDFYADWCGPCKMMGPIFEDTSKEYEGKVKFVKLDVQSNEGLAAKFGVQGIPTLVILKDGEEKGRITGMTTKDALKQKIESLI